MSDALPSPTIVGQLGDVFQQVSSPVEYAGILATVAVLLLGAYVGYQAYRGFRRNENRPVLFLGLGIFLATTVRQLASIATYLAVGENTLLLYIVFFGISIGGLAFVLYAFLWA